MSVTFDNSKRQVFPRFVDYTTACALGLLRTTRNASRNTFGINDRTKKGWVNNRNIFSAIDLVGEAIIAKDFDSTDAVEAAEYILSSAPQPKKLVRELASILLAQHSLIKTEDTNMVSKLDYRTIANLKKTVRFYPFNPISWNDLSLCYASYGQIAKAKKAMQVALDLGRRNRFILRSAARCFTHLGEPDRAIYILNKSGLCSIDPWISSAEIAICEGAGITSKCIGKAKDLLQNDNLTEFSRSELAVNVGTIQMKNGIARSAKKLMRQSLQDPTENALAQAQWMANELGTHSSHLEELERLEVEVPGSFEAKALRLYYNLKFEDSLKSAEMWSRFQQLSSRPIIHGSHIAAAFLNDDKRAISILQNATLAQKHGFLYFNNYAFSLARSGDIEGAIKQLDNIDVDRLSARDKAVWIATTGLIRFRSGDFDGGRTLYEVAISEFDRMDDAISASVATYYLAREEKRIRSTEAEKRVGEAKKRLERFNTPLLSQLVKML